jgi:hypothetical protein
MKATEVLCNSALLLIPVAALSQQIATQPSRRLM